MSLFSTVASALQSGLSQPVNFTAFVNQQIAQAQGRVQGAVNQAAYLPFGALGAVNSTINNVNSIGAQLSGIGNSLGLGGSFSPLPNLGFAGGGPGRPIGYTQNINPQGTLSRMQARGDPLLSIDWTATIVDTAGSPIEDIYIDALQTPSLRFDNKPVYRQGTTVNYAAGLSIDNANLVLYNDTTGKAPKFASSWFNAIFNFKTRNFRVPKEYKKDIIVWLLDVKGNVICQIDLVGCFPVSLNSLNLESTGSNLLPITLDLSVDHCYFSGP
jgi:hypothetical protein